MFLNVNRGKRSLALDLKQPAARAALLRLAETADVFVHSMRAQAIGRLGLDYAALKSANPRIIYANLYGFGRTGDRKSHTSELQSLMRISYAVFCLKKKKNHT